MTPAEHYAEAERLVAEAATETAIESDDMQVAVYLLRAAQVHATLATASPRWTTTALAVD